MSSGSPVNASCSGSISTDTPTDRNLNLVGVVACLALVGMAAQQMVEKRRLLAHRQATLLSGTIFLSGSAVFYIGPLETLTYLPEGFRVQLEGSLRELLGKEADLHSSFPSLLRLMHAREKLKVEKMVGDGRRVWLSNLAPGGAQESLDAWARWFTAEIADLEKLLELRAAAFNAACSDQAADSHQARTRLDDIGAQILSNRTWWPVIKQIVDRNGSIACTSRYHQLRTLANVPSNGLEVLRQVYRAGQEWKTRRWIEGRANAVTPFPQLNQAVDLVRKGGDVTLDFLADWAASIGKNELVQPAIFHRYLAHLLPQLPAYRQERNWKREQMVAAVELGLLPFLKELYAQTDPLHERVTNELVKEGRPLAIGEQIFTCVEQQGEGCYLFRGPNGAEKTVAVSFVNAIQLHLSLARDRQKKPSHLKVPQLGRLWGGVVLEAETVKPFNWEKPPEDFAFQLSKLKDGMPADLSDPLRTTSNGNTCWVYSGELVPFDAARIEDWLHQKAPNDAPTLMKKSGLLEAGKQQREEVLQAIGKEDVDLGKFLSKIEGKLEEVMTNQSWDIDKLREELDKADLLLYFPREWLK